MPKIPDSTKNSLHWRLATRARERWPALAEVRMRYRAGFGYVDGVLPDGEVLRLCRLRYLSSATIWGFAIYRASHDDYEDSVLPSGSSTGTAEEALDCACGLYLNDPPPGPHTPDVSTQRSTSDVDHCRAPPMLAQAYPAITARALGCGRERRSRCPQLSGGGPTGAVSPRRAT